MAAPEKRVGTAGTTASIIVLLLRSEHTAWDGVRDALPRCAEIRVVEGGVSAEWTLDLAAQDPPSLIVAPIRAAWAAMSDLLAALHERHPAAKMALLGELPSAAGLRLLRDVPLCTYLGWDEVLPDSLWLLLGTALTLDLRIASGSLLRRYPLDLEPQLILEPQFAPPTAVPTLTPLQRDVLLGLAAGLTRAEIAEQLECGPRSVYRAIARLRRRFGVRSDFQLALVADRMGLLAA